MRICLLLLLFSTSFGAIAQDDNANERKFFAGVNIGTKIANKYYALRYDGWYQLELQNALINNVQTYNEIKIRLGGFDFYLPNDFAPGRPRYSPGLLTGLLLGWKMTPELQVSVEANFNKLKMRDVFSVVVDDPGNQTSQNEYQLGDIYAEESRFNARFNLDYINDGKTIDGIFGINGQFGAWRIDQQIYTFQNVVMPIYSVNNLPGLKKVAGIGWGVGFNLGIEYRFNKQIVAQLMYQPHHSQFDFDIGIAKRFRIQHDILVRILWK